ncbi:MAG TPA: hypothetical protein VLD58_12365 [Gemmatimonadales bacterium]|nr:hypothetical protein [Gemmatimonadales bacterium]
MVNIFPKGELEGVLEALREIERDTTTKLHQVATYTGIRAVETVKSLTAEMRPPARKPNGEWTGPRRAHPGHWADITGILVNSYYAVATIIRPGQVDLEMGNTASYAQKLEDKDNYWVLEGVAAKGGPVEQALAQAVAALAPDWKLTSEGSYG